MCKVQVKIMGGIKRGDRHYAQGEIIENVPCDQLAMYSNILEPVENKKAPEVSNKKKKAIDCKLCK